MGTKGTKENTLELLTVQDVATNESVSTKTVYEWIKDERIGPVHYVGKNKQTILVGANYKIIKTKRK